jgi:hypothetical protein
LGSEKVIFLKKFFAESRENALGEEFFAQSYFLALGEEFFTESFFFFTENFFGSRRRALRREPEGWLSPKKLLTAKGRFPVVLGIFHSNR